MPARPPVVASEIRPEDLEQHRRELTGYCYRMLGSGFEAEDAVQETMVRAWRGIDGFERRSAVRSWLYRIATNVCLDMLRGRQRRARPMDLGPSSNADSTRVGPTLPEATWVLPGPEDRVMAADGDPAELGRWLLGPGSGCRGSRLVPAAANGTAAFGQYRSDGRGGHRPWALQVVEISGDRISGLHNFLVPEPASRAGSVAEPASRAGHVAEPASRAGRETELFAAFGLPARLGR